MNLNPRHNLYRLVFVFLSLVLVITGVKYMAEGSIGWSNYWGGLVFPPFAVLVGLLLLYVGMFRWERLIKAPKTDKKGRVRDFFKDDRRKRYL